MHGLRLLFSSVSTRTSGGVVAVYGSGGVLLDRTPDPVSLGLVLCTTRKDSDCSFSKFVHFWLSRVENLRVLELALEGCLS